MSLLASYGRMDELLQAAILLIRTGSSLLIHTPPQAPPCRCWRRTAAWTNYFISRSCVGTTRGC